MVSLEESGEITLATLEPKLPDSLENGFRTSKRSKNLRNPSVFVAGRPRGVGFSIFQWKFEKRRKRLKSQIFRKVPWSAAKRAIVSGIHQFSSLVDLAVSVFGFVGKKVAKQGLAPFWLFFRKVPWSAAKRAEVSGIHQFSSLVDLAVSVFGFVGKKVAKQGLAPFWLFSWSGPKWPKSKGFEGENRPGCYSEKALWVLLAVFIENCWKSHFLEIELRNGSGPFWG